MASLVAGRVVISFVDVLPICRGTRALTRRSVVTGAIGRTPKKNGIDLMLPDRGSSLLLRLAGLQRVRISGCAFDGAETSAPECQTLECPLRAR